MAVHTTGVYLLFITARGKARIGRLGEQAFHGSYVYVGSARGPGGSARLRRHYEVARGQRVGGRWHIDSLLALGQLETALFVEAEGPVECLLAQRLGRVAPLAVAGFGSSDCRCPGHLFRMEGNRSEAVRAAADLGRCRWMPFSAQPQKGRPPAGGGP